MPFFDPWPGLAVVQRPGFALASVHILGHIFSRQGNVGTDKKFGRLTNSCLWYEIGYRISQRKTMF